MTPDQVTVGTTATLVVDIPSGKPDGKVGRTTLSKGAFRAVIRSVTGAATIYLGGAGVTTGDGFALEAGEALVLEDLLPGEQVYGVVAAGTETAFSLVYETLT